MTTIECQFDAILPMKLPHVISCRASGRTIESIIDVVICNMSDFRSLLLPSASLVIYIPHATNTTYTDID